MAWFPVVFRKKMPFLTFALHGSWKMESNLRFIFDEIRRASFHALVLAALVAAVLMPGPVHGQFTANSLSELRNLAATNNNASGPNRSNDATGRNLPPRESTTCTSWLALGLVDHPHPNAPWTTKATRKKS